MSSEYRFIHDYGVPGKKPDKDYSTYALRVLFEIPHRLEFSLKEGMKILYWAVKW